MAREADAVDDRLDLAVADAGSVRRVRVGVVGVEQFGGEVVGAVHVALGDERPAIPPVVEHARCDLRLLLGGRLPPGERPAVDAPRFDQRIVLRWESDEAEHDLGGKRERDGLHEFGG